MNELSEFFKTVSIEKTRVAEERKRFEPRIEIKETDLSDFFGTVKTGQQNQIVLAQREGTKLNALQTFFTRLQTFENSLQEQIEKQKEDDNWEDTESYEIEQLKKEKTESEKKQEELEPIVETKQEERFPTAEERWPRAGETIKEIKQVEVKPVNYFNINKRPEPKVEETDVNSLAQAMSGLIKKPDEVITEQVSDLERLRLEFDKFRKLVNLQMASIGGGGETRLLKLDDVDTSSLGNGKFLVFNSTTNKLEFTDQIDGN
tara:strand:- start:48 stop:830 length:783 start_codon:yes stop_codon:yes gene_type:complete